MTRVCKRCNIEKSLDDFYLALKSEPNGRRQHVCKKCRVKQNYPDYNPNVTENNKRYYENNKEKILKKVHNYRKTERFKQNKKNYYDKNKEIIRKKSLKNHYKRILKTRARIANHTAKKSNSEGVISAFDLWCIAKKQKLKCPFTGKKLISENISLDHIIPLSKGGKNTKDNIRLVTKEVNTMKWFHMDKEFILLCYLVVNNQIVINKECESEYII